MSETTFSTEQVLECFQAISSCTHQLQPLDFILNTAVNKVREILQTDRVIISRLQPDGRGVVIAESVGSGWTSILGQAIHNLSFEFNLAETDNRHNHNININAGLMPSKIQPSHWKLLPQFQERANLIVPIVASIEKAEHSPHNLTYSLNRQEQGKCLVAETESKVSHPLWGLIIAHQCSRPRQWQTIEVSLLQQLAVQIDIAIQQIQLRQKLQIVQQRQQETQQQLQASERFFHSFYEREENSIFMVNVLPSGEFRLGDFNPAYERLTGLRSEDVHDKSPEEVFAPAIAAAVSANYARCVELATTISYEECLFFHGEESWWLTTLTPLQDIHSRIYGLIGNSVNITHRKQAEEKLRRQEAFLRYVIDANPNLIAVKDWEGRFMLVNQALADVYGTTVKEITGKLETDFHSYPAEVEQYLQDEREVMTSLQPKFIPEETLTTSTGGVHYIQSIKKPLLSSDGHTPYVLVVATDITQRKQAEQERDRFLQQLEQHNQTLEAQVQERMTALRESESRFRRLFESNVVGVVCADFSGNVTDANELFLSMVGYTRDELLLGQVRWDKMTPPEYRDSDEQAIEQFRTNRVCIPWEKEYIRKDGTRVPVMIGGALLDGYDDRVIVFVLDISNLYDELRLRKQAEEALQESEHQFRQIFQNSPIAISLADFHTHRFIRVNPAHSQLLGYTTAELATLTFNDISHPDDLPRNLQGLKQIDQGKLDKFRMEKRFLRKNGDVIWTNITVSVVPDPEGKPKYSLGMIEDITEYKQAEDKIKASLLEKETLLKEIHHRVKNNLQIISSLLRLQSRQIRDTQALELFKESQNRVQAMALIHEKLYQSSNLDQIYFQDYIQPLVQGLFRSYDAHIHNITFNINVQQISLPIALAIPCGLIINELVSNSLKYAFLETAGGQICINLLPVEEKLFEPLSKGQCILSISDNGVGLPEDLDFRKTNSLGLQLVCRLTKQLEGIIELDRSQGTEFKIKFAIPNRDLKKSELCLMPNS